MRKAVEQKVPGQMGGTVETAVEQKAPGQVGGTMETVS